MFGSLSAAIESKCVRSMQKIDSSCVHVVDVVDQWAHTDRGHGIYWIWAWTWCEPRPYIYRSVLLICFRTVSTHSRPDGLCECDVLQAMRYVHNNGTTKREIYTNFKVNAWFAHVNEFSIEPFRSHWRISNFQSMRHQRVVFQSNDHRPHDTDRSTSMEFWFVCWSIFSRFPRRRLIRVFNYSNFIKMRPSRLPLLILFRFFFSLPIVVSMWRHEIHEKKIIATSSTGLPSNGWEYIVDFHDFIYAKFRFVSLSSWTIWVCVTSYLSQWEKHQWHTDTLVECNL